VEVDDMVKTPEGTLDRKQVVGKRRISSYFKRTESTETVKYRKVEEVSVKKIV
jgi:hypothetical protein